MQLNSLYYSFAGKRFSKYDEDLSVGGINEKELNSMNKHIPGNYHAQCVKIPEKISFNTTSEASNVHILSGHGQKVIKNAKNSQFGFETEGCGRTVLPDTVETFFSKHLSLIKELYLYPQKIFKRFVQLLEAFGGKVIERRKMAGDQ